MLNFLNRTALWIARNRKLQRGLAAVLPKTATYPVMDEIQVEIPLLDQTGPGFYLNYGGPAAFYHYEEIEKVELLRFIPAQGVFLDVGANLGLFSLYLARLLPRLTCVAFEPDPLLAECLRQTIQKSPFPQITVEEVCLGNQSGKIPLYTHKKNSGGNSIVPTNICPPEQGKVIEVNGTTLDLWVEKRSLQRLDAIKVDVQGAEWVFLQGAQKTLQRYRPCVLIEIENQVLLSSAEATQLLESEVFENFVFRIAGTACSLPISNLRKVAAEEVSLGHISSNYFFIPSERWLKA